MDRKMSEMVGRGQETTTMLSVHTEDRISNHTRRYISFSILLISVMLWLFWCCLVFFLLLREITRGDGDSIRV